MPGFTQTDRRLYLILLGAVFCGAAFLRFFRLDVLPLGFHHDEALDAIAALEVWTKGQHPIFFPEQGSREPLMIYLESLSILMLGPTRLAARLAQACVGTAGVVAAWCLFKAMFGRRVALLATAVMAASFWQMFESRLGLRAISQPLVETLCLLFLWRTFAARRWPDALLSGLFLGLSFYTYTAARVLPLLIVLLLLWQAAVSPGFARKQWHRVPLLIGASVVVFAPLGVYALRNPQDFFGRSLQVNLINPEPFTGAAYSGGVGAAVLHTLGMFSIQGDPAWKYNIGGLPVFDWPVSALFYAGLIVALLASCGYLRQRRPERSVASPHAFILMWLAVMLLPGFLSSEAPHFLRTIGIMPAVFLLPALALDWILTRWPFTLPLVGLFLLGEGVETGYRYFGQWARSPEAYYAMHADAAAIAGYLAGAQPAEPVLFSSEYPGHPTLNYLAPRQFAQIRWFNGRESLAFPPAGRPYLYVFTAQYQPDFADLSKLFSPDEFVTQGADPAGGIAYRIYRSAAPPQLQPVARLVATVGALAHLDGVSAPSTVSAGEAFAVQEYWHALAPGSPDIRAFLHLVDAQGHVWAQADSLGYYAEDWQAGDQAINGQRLQVPPDTPPLSMQLLFGMYSSTTGQQLSVTDAAGQPLGAQVALGAVQVQPAATTAPALQPPHAVARQLSASLTLAGFELPRTSVRAGDTLPVTLWWRVTGPPADVPAIEVSGALAGLDLQERGLRDLLPPARWPDGLLQDRRELIVPPTARAGAGDLEVGGVRLGSVSVTELARAFTLPALQHQLDLPVGDVATVAGYDLAPLEPGRPLRLTLVWRARAAAATSYKVFVHVLDAGNRVIAQRDDFPQAGAMPTTFWLPGQVVVDRYEVPLPATVPIGAQLEIGMYDPSSGKRLMIGSEDRLLLPLTR